MKNRRKPLVRLALRRLARQHPEHRENIRLVLRDPDMLDAVTEGLCHVSENKYGIGDNSFMDFLDWLLEHADEILALIAKIVDMFM